MRIEAANGEKFYLQTPLYTVENTAAEPQVVTIPMPEGSTVALYTNESLAEAAIKNGDLENVAPKRIGSDKELKTLLGDFQKKGVSLVSVDFDNRAGHDSGRCVPIVAIFDAQ